MHAVSKCFRCFLHPSIPLFPGGWSESGIAAILGGFGGCIVDDTFIEPHHLLQEVSIRKLAAVNCSLWLFAGRRFWAHPGTLIFHEVFFFPLFVQVCLSVSPSCFVSLAALQQWVH